MYVALALDAAGNVYFSDSAHSAVKVWQVATRKVVLLADDRPSGFEFHPTGVAVDAAGNVYFADTYLPDGGGRVSRLMKCNPSDPAHPIVLVNYTDRDHLTWPSGLAVDSAGNVYIADTLDNSIKKWDPSTLELSTLISGDLNNPYGVAVDAAGNVYIADTDNNAIKKWNAATPVTPVPAVLTSGLNQPWGLAVDAARNVYIADTYNNAIKMIVRAYVPGRAVSEGATAGSDALQVVLPSAQSLTGLFAPKSDQNWLTIGPIANGVIRFAFTANPGPTRTAHITVLGQKITVTQVGLVTSLIRRIPVGMFPGVPNSLQNLTRVLGGWNA